MYNKMTSVTEKKTAGSGELSECSRGRSEVDREGRIPANTINLVEMSLRPPGSATWRRHASPTKPFINRLSRPHLLTSDSAEADVAY